MVLTAEPSRVFDWSEGRGDATQTSLSEAPSIVIGGTHACLALLIPVGTGGALTSEWMRTREANFFCSEQEPSETIAQPAPGALSNEIGTIKKNLGLSVSEIAKCLGVSRPTIYNWKSGTALKDANAARFNSLFEAALALE